MIDLKIVLFLIVFAYVAYYVCHVLIKKRLIESFDSDPLETQILTNNDSHYFLTQPILPGKTDINNLKETNPFRSNFFYLDKKYAEKEDPDPNVTKYPKVPHYDLKPYLDKVKERQPYIFDKPYILYYYGYPFYYDWRYPERPIDIKFATNPEKYVEQNPHLYPSYRFLSKNLKF